MYCMWMFHKLIWLWINNKATGHDEKYYINGCPVILLHCMYSMLYTWDAFQSKLNELEFYNIYGLLLSLRELHFTDDDDYADATLTWFVFVTQRIKMGRISATGNLHCLENIKIWLLVIFFHFQILMENGTKISFKHFWWFTFDEIDCFGVYFQAFWTC